MSALANTQKAGCRPNAVRPVRAVSEIYGYARLAAYSKPGGHSVRSVTNRALGFLAAPVLYASGHWLGARGSEMQDATFLRPEV